MADVRGLRSHVERIERGRQVCLLFSKKETHIFSGRTLVDLGQGHFRVTLGRASVSMEVSI